ncbi:fibroblast growth factor binding protein 2a [Diretmus argenteus]
MWTQAGTLLLLLACCLWLAEAQSDTRRRMSIWDDPIKFNTKASETCTMMITGQGELTRLRISCRGVHSYWCEYVGKPHTCPAYNNNPRHFFVQMMWRLRKLHNPCRAPRLIKPHMCRMASDESQMIFSSASFPQQRSEEPTDPGSRQTGPRPATRPATRPQIRPAPSEPDPAREASTKQQDPPGVRTTKPAATPRPTAPTAKSKAKQMAEDYCWRSLKGVCAYVFGWFRK